MSRLLTRRITLVVFSLLLVIAISALGTTPGPSEAAPSAAEPTWSSSVTVQNLSNATANIAIGFYSSEGAQVGGRPLITDTIGPRGNRIYFVPNVADLPSGQYSVVVSSDVPVAAVANLSAANPTMGGSYSGVEGSVATSTVYVPVFAKGYYTSDSVVTVQNAGQNTANVNVKVYDRSGGVAWSTDTTVPASSAKQFSSRADTVSLPEGFIGSMVIASTNSQPLVGIVNTIANGQKLSSTNAFAAGGQQSYAPLLMNNYYGWVSSLTIQNLNLTQSAQVRVTYFGGGTTVAPRTIGIPAASSVVLFQPNEGHRSGWLGSARVESLTGQAIVSIVSNAGTITAGATSYGGSPGGTTKILMPALYNDYYGYVSSMTIQNIGSSPTLVRVTYTNSSLSPKVYTVQPGENLLRFQPNEGFPIGWSGGAVIESLDPSDQTLTKPGQPIIAVGSMDSKNSSAQSGDGAMVYNGINQ